MKLTNAWLAVATAFALALGGLALDGSLSFDTLVRGEPVVLTGKAIDGSGRLAAIDLWTRPGFSAERRVAARVALPSSGQLPGRRVREQRIDGLGWSEVAVRGSRGWVLNRFIAD
jgi:hypothetical protein